MDLSALNGTDGFQITGEAGGEESGFSVSAAGDINGDTFLDFLIGSPFGGVAAAHVVFGQASGFGSNLDLSALDGANGFQINAEAVSDYAGRSVAGAGDLNGDGFDDLIIGAHRYDGSSYETGAAYVVFGKASGFAADLE